MLSVTISRGVIPQAELLSSTSKKDSSNVDKSKYKLVGPGDVVYNKMRAWQGAAGGSNYRGIVSPAYIVMSPREALAEYMHHVVRTPQFAKEAERWSYGITSDQWSLRPEHFKMIRFPLPPAEEQAAIVKYLAHANTRIDKAIAAKRRLMVLLDEQAGFRRASLLEGVGQEQRLANVIWEGPTNGISPEVSESGSLRSLSISVVRDGVVDVRASDIKYVERAKVRDVKKYALRAGDILLVRGNGNLKLVGRAARVVDDLPDQIYPDLLMRIRLRSGIDSRFIVAALNSPTVREQIEAASRTAVGTYKLSGADVRGLRVPIPNLDAQRGIVQELESIDADVARVAARLRREVFLLEEFRTRLVADVVTGQVDVRMIAASLTDAPDQDTDLNSMLDDDLEDVLGEGEE
ncbi:hypothetical protein EG850_08835 [Gulosibacter macacae]|uniref:Type I restriction modification DNA specificity domain-containing protein n=1 Tax=Gulosibacter macacae TaxID=2488791 RepID=A0A3P3VYD5_9MICO|nr:hypothetical protein [Gulosibacter macacae]RRJ86439.1 hypothetical protein EG850_08835 [Gulosibacter macacae]